MFHFFGVIGKLWGINYGVMGTILCHQHNIRPYNFSITSL